MLLLEMIASFYMFRDDLRNMRLQWKREGELILDLYLYLYIRNTLDERMSVCNDSAFSLFLSLPFRIPIISARLWVSNTFETAFKPDEIMLINYGSICYLIFFIQWYKRYELLSTCVANNLSLSIRFNIVLKNYILLKTLCRVWVHCCRH